MSDPTKCSLCDDEDATIWEHHPGVGWFLLGIRCNWELGQ